MARLTHTAMRAVHLGLALTLALAACGTDTGRKQVASPSPSPTTPAGQLAAKDGSTDLESYVAAINGLKQFCSSNSEEGIAQAIATVRDGLQAMDRIADGLVAARAFRAYLSAKSGLMGAAADCRTEAFTFVDSA